MPALGAPELIIILLLVVIVFGVGKLPEIGGALGKGIKEFRSAADDQPFGFSLASDTERAPEQAEPADYEEDEA